MSKVAAYLRGHVSGEVSTRTDVRAAMSIDTGVLHIMPEMVMYPRTTNDIRKIARFAWQLAEKGHVLPITVRGAGTDGTGAALGKGAIVATAAHMNNIFEYDAKQRLVRLQPGVTISALQSALGLQGTSVMTLCGAYPYSTVGGAIANAFVGPFTDKYGTIAQAIDKLEVVLANGDVLQTGRISKRELSRKKGLQGFEGDIYRGIDGIIDEYKDLLGQLSSNDGTGYNAIADVKRKDGSFDLTPLFVGSQGTLGAISEMILKGDYRSNHLSVVALVFTQATAARDALDQLAQLSPAFLEYFDAQLFEASKSAGRTYKFYAEASLNDAPQSVVLIGFDEFNDRARSKMVKKVTKKFGKTEGVTLTIDDSGDTSELALALDVAHCMLAPDQIDLSSPRLFGGFHIPTARLEDFVASLHDLAESEHIELPMSGHVMANTYTVYPLFSLHKVSDKQSIFKLFGALTKLVYSHGGIMIAEGGEGRLKAHAIYPELDAKVVSMYQAVRKVCDPLGTLNPGVKQDNDVRTTAAQVRDNPALGRYAPFGIY